MLSACNFAQCSLLGELHQLQRHCRHVTARSFVLSFEQVDLEEPVQASWRTIVKAAGKMGGFVCKQSAVEVRRRSLVELRGDGEGRKGGERGGGESSRDSSS